MSQEPTITNVLEKIDQLSTKVDQGFKGVNERLDTHDEFFVSIKQSFNHIEERFDRLESTTNSLIDVLQENKVISSYEAKHVKAIA